jgi:hypothetical protein
VIQGRSGACFAAKSLKRLSIPGNVIGQKLQGHKPAELRVFSLVDHSHAAAAEQGCDLVVGNSLADHERVIVRSPA